MTSTHSTMTRPITGTPTIGQRASLIYLWALQNDHGCEMDRLIASRFLATADADGCFTMKREEIRRLVPRGDWAIAEVVTSLEHSGLVERLGRTSWRLCPALLEAMQVWTDQEAVAWAEEKLVLPELPLLPVLTRRTGQDVEQPELEEQWGLFGADGEHAFHFEHSETTQRVSEAGVEVWQQQALFNASLPVTCAAAHKILEAIAASFEPKTGEAAINPEHGEVSIEEVDLMAVTGLSAGEVRELMAQFSKQVLYDTWQEGTLWQVNLTAMGAATLRNYLRGEN